MLSSRLRLWLIASQTRCHLVGLPFGCTRVERERERESWFFANIFSVWHPDRLSLESNQDAKIFRAKKSTVCKKKHRASGSLRSDSAAKQQAVNVIGSLHHMSQWSWVFMHRWWIRIIRPLAVTWIGFLSNSSKNMWRECRFFFTPRRRVLPFFSPQSASEQGFQFPAVHKRGVVIIGRPERVWGLELNSDSVPLSLDE